MKFQKNGSIVPFTHRGTEHIVAESVPNIQNITELSQGQA